MKETKERGQGQGKAAEQTDAGASSQAAHQIRYQSGFGNQFATEAQEGALPQGQNSPQRAAMGLYAEQISGSSFTAARSENLRSWFYRIRPSVMHPPFTPYDSARFFKGRPFSPEFESPNQMRWDALPLPIDPTDFLDGIVTYAGNGESASWRGCAVHLYAANQSMKARCFFSADGEMLIVPEKGRLLLRTEFGIMEIAPGEFGVVPRGVKFQVQLPDGTARGYICENYGPPLRLPSLGPIGSNGLANPRDFLTPVAAYEDKDESFQVISKFQGKLWHAELDHSPLNVVAWHGNYAPYKYDLANFQAINTVSFDHCDPSIFTVLSSPSEVPGFANVDFVIFPPRWMVAEETFRPPYYHRNLMSEFMGLIYGVYDAKEEGFMPGGASLHNCMSAHGPDAATFEKASSAELKPVYVKDTLAFMFESSLVFTPTQFAATTKLLQKDYMSCWQDLKRKFDAKAPSV